MLCVKNNKEYMNMKVFQFTILMTILFAPGIIISAPISSPMTASYLLAACQESETNKYAKGFCDGAIDAFYSSIQDWCVPPSVTHGEVKQHIKSALLSSDLTLSRSALEFVSRTVQKKWPCS
jgi:hypothetical protein